tara:strand:- start:177 stop:389 length:213 start_codon:yes stop_codon:yes gene_type:complete
MSQVPTKKVPVKKKAPAKKKVAKVVSPEKALEAAEIAHDAATAALNVARKNMPGHNGGGIWKPVKKLKFW